MRKRIPILCFFVSLLYLPGLAQLSFGVKFGGSTLPDRAFESADIYQQHLINTKDRIDDWRALNMEFDNEPGVNLSTNSPELLARLDTFTAIYTKPRRINMEFGAYFSVPISQRSRLRLEVAYHEFDYDLILYKGGFPERHIIGGNDIIQPDSLYRFNPISSAAIINSTIGRFIRPSLHFHYYFSRNVSIVIGASISLPLRGNGLQGFSYTFGEVEREVHDPINNTKSFEGTDILYELVDRIDGPSIKKNVFIPGTSFGFLFKIRGLPKIEIRATSYFPSIIENHGISFKEKEFQISSIPNTPIKYTPHLKIDDFFSLSAFVEL